MLLIHGFRACQFKARLETQTKMEEPKRSTEKLSFKAYHCCVPCCTNDSRYDEERTLSFHKFPKNLTRHTLNNAEEHSFNSENFVNIILDYQSTSILLGNWVWA